MNTFPPHAQPEITPLIETLRRKPALQAEQSTSPLLVHSVAPEPEATVGVPFGHEQVLARHATIVKLPDVVHVAVPPPAKPCEHVTVTL